MRKIIISLCFIFTFILIGIGFLCINSNAVTTDSTIFYYINDNGDFIEKPNGYHYYAKNWNTSIQSVYLPLFNKSEITGAMLYAMFGSGYNEYWGHYVGKQYFYYTILTTGDEFRFNINEYQYRTISLFFTGFGDYFDDYAPYLTDSNYRDYFTICVAPRYRGQNSIVYSSLGSNALDLGTYWTDYAYNVNTNSYSISNMFEVCFDFSYNSDIIAYDFVILTDELFTIDGDSNPYNSSVTYVASNNIANGLVSSEISGSSYNSGFQYGLQVGNRQAIEENKDSWIEQGRIIGYSQGYDEASSSNRWFGDGLLRLVDVPFILFNQFLNFEILGINFYYIILALMTLLIAFFIIKKMLR